jgi:hypothetical protein
MPSGNYLEVLYIVTFDVVLNNSDGSILIPSPPYPGKVRK